MTAITQHPDLTELRGLLGKATLRPWRAMMAHWGQSDIVSFTALKNAGLKINGQPAFEVTPYIDPDDAALIVAAVNALPGLLHHIDRLTEDNVRLRASLAPFAALQMPAKCEGNAAIYSILHKSILAARQALTPAASEGKS